MSLMTHPALEAQVTQFREELSHIHTDRELDLIKSQYLGKKSLLHQELSSLGSLSTEERKLRGEVLNRYRQQLLSALEEHRSGLEQKRIDQKLKTISDPTVHRLSRTLGGRHPVDLAAERLMDILHARGFQTVQGPEIEHVYYNFTALNVGEDHPARAEQDTFYLQDPTHLLRTHTSPMQIRTLEQRKPPIRMMALGRVYRADFDATHTPMFHQLEGMVIDEHIHMGHLKECLLSLLKAFFNADDLRIQFRPGYFPFTEPSAEVDIWWKDRWLEVLGCGMIHPAVLENLGIDGSRYQGYAFGLGVDRLAMLRYNIHDLRAFFENDHRFSAQFREHDA